MTLYKTMGMVFGASLLIFTSGCLMDSGSDAPGAGGADYKVRVEVVNGESDDFVVREGSCTVIGFDSRGVVTVTDPQTGVTAPYEVSVEVLTPQTISIYNYDGVKRIEYVCTVVGKSGDSLHCEAKTRSGLVAPLLGSIDFAMMERVPETSHWIASCEGVISTIS